MSAEADAEDDGAARDARDLGRGLVVNLGGYALRLAVAGLLAATIRLYGAEQFGVFALVQAALYLASRTCSLGLGKGILWWVHQPAARGRAYADLCAAATLAWIAASIVAVVLAVAGGPWIARWAGAEAAEHARWMVFGLVPLTLAELVTHAAVARRRLEAQAIVQGGLAPLTLGGGAVVLHLAGCGGEGLAIAFLLSTLVGLAGAIAVLRRAFPADEARAAAPTLRPPPALLRYAAPIWASEVLGALLLRLDVALLAALAEPRTVGVYAACVHLAGAIRQVRRSFDPMVLAIVTEIGAAGDRPRLRAGLTRASALVLAIQAVVLAFLVAFAAWLLPLLGDGFAGASAALLILAGAYAVDGVLGLHGLVVAGHGRSGLVLVNVAVTIGALVVLMPLLVPALGLVGAALAVGLAHALQNALQVTESRLLTGTFGYTRELRGVVGLAAIGAAIMAAAFFGLQPLGEAAARIGAFVAFALAAGIGGLWLRRRGR